MEAPIVIETVRRIPNGVDITGFPFDDTEYQPERTTRPFRSQLDDIAQRHPELAEHFQGFPFRSNTWGHKRRGSGSTGEDDARSQASSSSNESTHPEHRRHPEHRQPFGSRFDNFFQPSFQSHFAEEDEPRFAQHHTPPPASQASQHHHQQTAQKPPREDATNRGRKQNPNLPQSNTVDLGQKQTPLDEIDRGQRSMSAPPDNRSSQRFVSSIHIPVNPQGQCDMGGHSSKPTAATTTSSQQPTKSKPNERVIPIHVEGRDEPVIPKNVNQQQQQPQHHHHHHHHHQQQQQQEAERMFGQEPSYFTKFLNRGGGAQQKQPQPADDDNFRQQQQQYQKQQQQQFQQQQQEQQQQPESSSSSSSPPPPPRPQPMGPIEQIKLIQSDVLELMNQVEKFDGDKSNKDYLYLDEMLTRNLIKLDVIETDGKDNIRTARREAIKCIQKCINILEAKANGNSAMEAQCDAEQPTQSEENDSQLEAGVSVGDVAMDVAALPDSSGETKTAETNNVVSSSSDVKEDVVAPSEQPTQSEQPMEVVADSATPQPQVVVEADSQTSETSSHDTKK